MPNVEKFVCFNPVRHPGDRVLVLGTMPSPASVKSGFYYGHPQNRFWKMLALLQNMPVPKSVPEKLDFLARGHIALWDVLASCDRESAADSTIKEEIPNDIAGLLSRIPSVRAIALNGAKAYALYQKHIAKTLSTELSVWKMPSTSPANAACGINALCDSWSKVLKEIAIPPIPADIP